MIKEISFKKNSKTNERINNSVEIDTVMVQPSSLRIELLQQIEYFNEKLNNANINIINEIPQADWIPVDRWTKLVCVSKKFKEVFEDKLKGYWYPTNNENYFIFLLNNCIHGLDETKTIIINKKERLYWYESIENETFKPEVENNEYLFTVPQEPNRKLSTNKFEELYRINNLTGIQFYKNINFNKKDKSNDLLRFKEYDEEGNCLG
jgi:hypothetical protein